MVQRFHPSALLVARVTGAALASGVCVALSAAVVAWVLRQSGSGDGWGGWAIVLFVLMVPIWTMILTTTYYLPHRLIFKPK